MKLALLLIVALASLTGVRADESPAPAPVTDPAIVSAQYQEIVTRPEFHETDETLADLRWGDWLTQWLTQLASRFHDFQYVGQFSTAARVLVIVITILAVAGVAWLLARLSRRRRDRAADEAGGMRPEGKALLSPQQYEVRLRQALEQRDWRGAWLAAWLQWLARLERRQWVEADRSRTNREYLAQLRARRLPAEALPLLTRIVDDYDRFIYGVRPIDEAGWTTFRERLEEATLMLGLRDRATEKPA